MFDFAQLAIRAERRDEPILERPPLAGLSIPLGNTSPDFREHKSGHIESIFVLGREDAPDVCRCQTLCCGPVVEFLGDVRIGRLVESVPNWIRTMVN